MRSVVGSEFTVIGKISFAYHIGFAIVFKAIFSAPPSKGGQFPK